MKCADLLQGIMRTEYEQILTDIRDYLVERKSMFEKTAENKKIFSKK